MGFAGLALAVRDPERAARLAAAAEGLRRRIGLRPWPMLRRRENVLRTQLGESLGRARFEEVFSAGTELNQREAIALAREVGAVGARPSGPSEEPDRVNP